jgi:hypothetical protein
MIWAKRKQSRLKTTAKKSTNKKSTNKRNLFTCQSAVNYRLNLCKANKVKKRAVLVLTLHKEYGIVIMHRISRYSSA